MCDYCVRDSSVLETMCVTGANADPLYTKGASLCPVLVTAVSMNHKGVQYSLFFTGCKP